MATIGILLTNTGTPDEPTPNAVRFYLAEFLSDKRVVKIPRFIWLPILYGLILPTRSAKSAKLYQKIWTPQGSPMRYLMQQMRVQLTEKLNANSDDIYIVELGMNYGQPSIPAGLEKLRKHQVEKIIVLPLFPQYSDTTTASSYDRVNAVLTKKSFTAIRDYATHPDYIAALAKSVQRHWMEKGKSQHLLISFHGIPERFVKDGDPYPTHCEQTAKLLAKALQLDKDEWTLCYQSQFGYDKWLKPSTQQLFTELPKRDIKQIDVICPGFAVDCLETLEEIAIKGKEMFLAAGGESLSYIPALNDSDEHVEALKTIINNSSLAA